MTERHYKLGEFAELMGVSKKSLQRWDNNGILVADRTDGCHRDYTQKHIDELNRLRRENSSKLTRKKNYKYEDLTDKEFGNLKVIERDDDWVAPNGHRHIMWKCECKACGNIVSIKGSSLKAGYNKSCKCLQYGNGDTKRMWEEYQKLLNDDVENESDVIHIKPGRPKGFKGGGNSFQDLSDKDFGFWHVVERGDTKKYKRGQIIYWKCRCRCGTIKQVPGRDLRSGASQSCGCMSKISWLEYFTKQWLEDNGFKYDYQKYYEDLLGTGGKPLVYDFIVYHNDKPICAIECQGEQHYRPIRKFGGAKKFLQQQIHDKLKKEYAENNLKIPLFEVLYTCMSEQSVYNALNELDMNSLI